MKMFNASTFDSLQDLLVEQIEDLYDAEKRLCDALPKMAEAASSPELAGAFRNHLVETKQHVFRLESIFKMLNREPSRETCDAMKGLIKESEEMIDAKGSAEVRDAALIAAAQRVEHYEMAGYGSAGSFAQHIGRQDVAEQLEQTLQEEKYADQTLTSIAESSVNISASRS